MSFALPDLPYPYEALQPYLSRETLEFHHDKHHAAYVTNANNLLKDSGLEIRPNERLTGVEVELTHRQPEVTGTVKTAEGVITRNAFVVIFPQDRQHWGYLSRYVRMSRPNPDNQYRVLAPPGEYLAIAVDFVEEGEWSEADFLPSGQSRFPRTATPWPRGGWTEPSGYGM